MRPRTAAALLLLSACLLVSCRTNGSGTSGIPDEDALRQRIDALFTAEKSEDWRGWYDLTAQARHGDSSYEEFLEAMGGGDRDRKFSIVSWKIVAVEPIEMKEESAAYTDFSVKVPMDVLIRRPDGATEKVPEHTDYWFHMDGRWYWGWRGFPSD